MLTDIKNLLNEPNVRRIMGEAEFDNSPEAMEKKAEVYRQREDLHLYGWHENNILLGTCGVEDHSEWVVIRGIAVEPSARTCGVGRKMITAIQEIYKTTIKAETDDDAVEFYRKCGFETEGFIKSYPNGECRRYECILHYNK